MAKDERLVSWPKPSHQLEPAHGRLGHSQRAGQLSLIPAVAPAQGVETFGPVQFRHAAESYHGSEEA